MSSTIREEYDDKIVRDFAWASAIWGIVGLLGGLLVAVLMFLPSLTDSHSIGESAGQHLSFGRLRPIHTNAIIFAFVGNGIFMGVYYSLQRLCKRRIFSDALSRAHFWLWQLIIVLAAVTFLLGYSTAKEYSELEWPIDVLITITWVVFGVNMLGTIAKRREKHMYVAIWFYLATFFAVAVLHVVNSLAIPASLVKSYSVFAGVQDALVQWWYGHNAVAFFLTTPYLGLMYYFVPKVANRPVYSYRLSIIHFWSLIFIYIWAGPHHLLATSLPDWCQTLGMLFSVMLIAPSWGGMLNGLLTLRGAWDKVREEPMLKFFVVAITAYGMATFEGPLLSVRAVNALSHYTDWTVGHTHIGGLGWNGFLTYGILYWLIPKLYKRELHSKKLANFHFWIGLLGIVIYAIPLYWAGITQGLMWMQFNDNGTLTYGQFIETVDKIIPMYQLRALGGLLYLVGALVMVYNLFMTARGAKVENTVVELPAEIEKAADKHEAHAPATGFVYKHRWLEGKVGIFAVLTFIALLIGGAAEIVPMYLVADNVKTIPSVKPYTALEQYGRDIYQREGCNTCHSQMIRPFRSEVVRYGDYSRSGEFVYDYPHLWGSKRIGPDIARCGVSRPDPVWHWKHMMRPQDIEPKSIMPSYPYLASRSIDRKWMERSVTALRRVGVPYLKGYESQAYADAMQQAAGIAASLQAGDLKAQPDCEMLALIAYLRRLGTDYRPEQAPAAPVAAGAAP